jgi:hypothetical protein
MASTVGFRIRRASSASRSSTSAVELAMSAKRMVTFFLSPSCAPRTRLARRCGVWTCAEPSGAILFTLASRSLGLALAYDSRIVGQSAACLARATVRTAKIGPFGGVCIFRQFFLLVTTAGKTSAHDLTMRWSRRSRRHGVCINEVRTVGRPGWSPTAIAPSACMSISTSFDAQMKPASKLSGEAE